MGGKTAAALCLEHVIGQDPLLGDIPVGLDLVLLDVLIDGRTNGFSWTAADSEINQVEAIHLTVVV